ncbi:DNA/RNA helicase [Macleaya cordata]|uniref:DNA/RNA helicase n=1 Tax=Macleaya cordata TaxID=56857 RepID=A0A200R586_MACCD|nr:DNA/RNA helicase [Macleaya cordata]
MKVQMLENGCHARAMRYHRNLDRPSKFLIMCLNSIQNALLHNGTFNNDTDKHLLVSDWGFEFWKCFSSGSDILETTGDCSSIEQIGWMVSTAADLIVGMEQQGLHIASPFLLFLVPSQEKIHQVCKPLKAHGIHTVSVHAGASLDHQIHGLKTCEPEFIVSTPERFLELISLKAIDLSGLSLLVIDGLGSFIRGGFLDKIKIIRQSIRDYCQTVIFNDSFGTSSTAAVQILQDEPICRLSLSDSIASQSACISQNVHTCTSEEKLLKGIQILNQEYGNCLFSEYPKVLFVGESGKTHILADSLIAKGYSVSNDAPSDSLQEVNSEKKPVVFVTDTEDVEKMSEFEIVIIVDFPPLIDNYVSILTRMARHTVNGVLHSFFCQGDAQLAEPLIEILEQCGQSVPETLRKYLYSSSFMLKR